MKAIGPSPEGHGEFGFAAGRSTGGTSEEISARVEAGPPCDVVEWWTRRRAPPSPRGSPDL